MVGLKLKVGGVRSAKEERDIKLGMFVIMALGLGTEN